METATFPGNYYSLEAIRNFYKSGAEQAGLDEKAVYEVQLAVDEAASNIIDHAYGGENLGKIECSYRASNGELEIIIRDFGKPFDPGLVNSPDLQKNLNNRKVRGLGLHFMNSLMDSVEFSFNGHGGNILTMVKSHASQLNCI